MLNTIHRVATASAYAAEYTSLVAGLLGRPDIAQALTTTAMLLRTTKEIITVAKLYTDNN
ncbi:hypothetical protein ACFWDA_25175 [Rhodococcus zopfii]|uniref:hypothetical protein n=1 Tax=Rhodococcus zopfii TaxID=43772 RepID=UPI00365343B8